MEWTGEQLLAFYRIARRIALLSSFISLMELSPDKNLYVYVGRYDVLENSIIHILSDGDYELWPL
jgi:hypothetical protein